MNECVRIRGANLSSPGLFLLSLLLCYSGCIENPRYRFHGNLPVSWSIEHCQHLYCCIFGYVVTVFAAGVHIEVLARTRKDPG